MTKTARRYFIRPAGCTEWKAASARAFQQFQLRFVEALEKGDLAEWEGAGCFVVMGPTALDEPT